MGAATKGLIGVMLASALALLSLETEARALKIATLSPDSSSWMKQMRAGGDRIRELTNDRVRLKFYPGGVMGDDQTVLRKIRIRQLHGGTFTGGGLRQFNPDNGIYSLPMKFRSLPEIDYVRARMDSIIISGIRKSGFVTFGLAGGGFAYLMSRQPVLSLADLRQRKVWVPKNDTMAQQGVIAMGLDPVPLKLADVLTGLQTGLIDTIATSPVAAIALQWHTQISYLTQLPLSYFYALMAIESSTFEALDTGDQRIVTEVMGQVFEDIDLQNRRDNQAALAALENLGISLLTPTSEQLSQWRDAAASASRQIQNAGHLSPTAVRTLEQHLQQFRNGHE